MIKACRSHTYSQQQDFTRAVSAYSDTLNATCDTLKAARVERPVKVSNMAVEKRIQRPIQQGIAASPN